jgi:isoaspartyl peptidase/L-asparaginase-like protein (Ntn-hydrolase superfamily)
MRDGAPPEIACKQAVERIAHRHRQTPNFQVAFVALNKNGEFGAYSLIKGFTYALMKDGQNYLYQSNFLF